MFISRTQGDFGEKTHTEKYVKLEIATTLKFGWWADRIQNWKEKFKFLGGGGGFGEGLIRDHRR